MDQAIKTQSYLISINELRGAVTSRLFIDVEVMRLQSEHSSSESMKCLKTSAENIKQISTFKPPVEMMHAGRHEEGEG